MLEKPRAFSSNKYINYNLYKKVDDNQLTQICNQEIETLKKKMKSDINQFISAGFTQHMYNKYRVKTISIINAVKV